MRPTSSTSSSAASSITTHEVSRRIFEAARGAIDIFFIGNDFGTQNGPVVSAALFRRFFLPHLKRLVDLGHDFGLKVMLHCCGGFAPLIPALIEIGLDALQSLQPDARGMEPGRLKRDFGGRIVLNGCIDTHHVLIKGTPELVRKRTREILEVMKPGGGYIASPSHDYLLPETPVENVLAMYETVQGIRQVLMIRRPEGIPVKMATRHEEVLK